MYLPNARRAVSFSARPFIEQVLPVLLRKCGNAPARVVQFKLSGTRGGDWRVRLSDGATMPNNCDAALTIATDVALFERLLSEPMDVAAEERAGRLRFVGDRALVAHLADAIEAGCSSVV
jgi:hypothetical protein